MRRTARPNAPAFALLAVALAVSLPASVRAAEFTVYTVSFPQLIEPAGEQAFGLYVDILRHVEQRTGHRFRWDFQPWPRAQVSAQNDPNGLIVNFTRNAERESKYRWIATMGWGRYGVFSLQQHGYRGVDDLKGKSIGHLRGSDVTNVLAEAGLGPLEAGDSNIANANKLHAGRIDGWAINLWTGPEAYRDAGHDADELRVIPIGEAWDQWIAGSPRFPAEAAAQIDAALRKLVSDGTVKALEAKYWRPLKGTGGPDVARRGTNGKP